MAPSSQPSVRKMVGRKPPTAPKPLFEKTVHTELNPSSLEKPSTAIWESLSAEFERRMQEIAVKNLGAELKKIQARCLLGELLERLGYKKLVRIYEDIENWYA